MLEKIHHAFLGVRKVLLLKIREAGGHSKSQYRSLHKPVLSCHLLLHFQVVSDRGVGGIYQFLALQAL